MAEAQSSLEYLIIISVTLAIVAVTAAIIVNSYSAQSSDYAYNACREAASRCKMAISGNPSEPCLFCNDACNFSDGTEIFSGAATCCTKGKASEIYSGSIGTNCVSTLPTPFCGDGDILSPEVCEGPGDPCGTAGTCSSDCLTCVEPPVLCPNGVIDGIEQCDSPSDCACPGQCKPDCTCPTISFQESLIGNTYDIQGSIKSVAIGDADNDNINETVVSAAGSLPDFTKVAIFNMAYSGHNFIETDIETGLYGVGPVVIGNADNVAGNEVIAETRGADGKYWLVMYKGSGSSWVKSNIGNTKYQILSAAIGNADNLGGNEIAVGTNAGTEHENVTRLYNYDSASAKWNETNISWVSCCGITATAIGDADNIAGNELVAAVEGATIIFYEYSGGAWRYRYDPLSDSPAGSIYSLAIGNADNVAGNEIILGRSNALIMYKYHSGQFVPWDKTVIPSTATGTFNAVAIGDADNDGLKEIILGTSSSQLRMYKYLCGQWKEIAISGPNRPITSVAIGNVDNDPGNEIVIGMAYSPSDNAPRMYKRV